MITRPKLNLLDRLLLRLLARPAVRAAVREIVHDPVAMVTWAERLKQETIVAVVDARQRGNAHFKKVFT